MHRFNGSADAPRCWEAHKPLCLRLAIFGQLRASSVHYAGRF